MHAPCKSLHGGNDEARCTSLDHFRRRAIGTRCQLGRKASRWVDTGVVLTSRYPSHTIFSNTEPVVMSLNLKLECFQGSIRHFTQSGSLSRKLSRAEFKCLRFQSIPKFSSFKCLCSGFQLCNYSSMSMPSHVHQPMGAPILNPSNVSFKCSHVGMGDKTS